MYKRNHMRYYGLLISVIGVFAITHGQTLERQVICPGGNTISSTDVELSVTIGEPLSTTHSSSEVILSDGIEQQFDLFTLSVITIKDFKLTLYPNPTVGLLKIASDEVIQSISIVNAMGQKLKTYSFQSTSKEIDVSDLPSGTYFIKVDQNNAQLTSKFIKI